jgi:hypothetical protein
MKNSLRGLKTKPLLLEPILNTFFVTLPLKARPVNCMKSLEDVYLGKAEADLLRQCVTLHTCVLYVYSMKIAVHGLLFASR